LLDRPHRDPDLLLCTCLRRMHFSLALGEERRLRERYGGR